MTETLHHLLSGEFVAGSGTSTKLLNPATEEVVAEVKSGGVDVAAAYDFARRQGGAGLRALSFRARAAKLKQLADLVHGKRDELLDLGVVNAGNTRSDAKFDVDGAAAVLAAYAELGATLPESGIALKDGEAAALGASSRLVGQHVFVPLDGVALLIDAYNFPAWGFIEKAAAAWLAGVPVVVKPATATCWMTERLVRRIEESGILPKGACSLVLGQPAGLLDALDERDAIAFTGSAATAARLREGKNVRERSIRLNVEADSLNSAIVAPDVEPGSETFELLVNDLFRDLTQKAGQKCTALRRAFVPASLADAVADALESRLVDVKIGDPSLDVRVGPLASAQALAAARDGIARLKGAAKSAITGNDERIVKSGFEGKGFFQSPLLLRADLAALDPVFHEVEVFGPCATLISWDDEGAMLDAVRRGGGSLVAAVYSDDRAFLKRAVLGVAASHGRIYIGSKKTAGSGVGPGTALPLLKHGGPGRAGGGEELGGLRALAFYQQRVALQGYGPLVDAILG
jgi:3,4-dehydroadipyl-CoA semialdehyde dehydrogenase